MELIAPIGIKNGQIEYTDYSQINNLLVCGTTGSGKTTFVRTLIASLISSYDRESVNFCIFDSKRVDYTEFYKIPHLVMPVLHDNKRCQGMLFWVLHEAEERLNLLSENSSDLKRPDIFVILDDYAQITQDPDVKMTLYKLLEISHRVKIHVIIVTSIALAKIISTELKVHIPHRISFFLPEKRNSQVVIDQNGAESLEMPGQFIAKFYSKVEIYNSIELLDSEIKKICEKQFTKHYENDPDENNSNIQNLSYFDDELYNAAVLAVIEAGKASTSFLQRKLKLGYGRARNLIDYMIQNGIIGPSDGLRPHEILITKEQFLNEKSKDSDLLTILDEIINDL
jgi:S-DNA-T family DNA segregation ATPase FtsK/SpoIIIE